MTPKATAVGAIVVIIALAGVIILAIAPDALTVVFGAAIGVIASIPIIVIMAGSRRAPSRPPIPTVDATWTYLPDPSNPSDPRPDRTQIDLPH